MSVVVKYSVERRIATITLQRPESGNAMTLDLCEQVFDALERADADDEVAAVVLTGAGRNFCVGADLNEGFPTLEGGNQRFTDFVERFGDFGGVPRDVGGVVTMRLAAMRTPVIAAINGAAVGAGASMILPCDIRIVGEGTRVGFLFGRRGMPTESVSSWFLPRVVGISRASEWVLTGRLVEASELYEAQLATRVVPDDEVLQVAHQLAAEIVDGVSQVASAVSRVLLWRGLAITDPWEAHALESRVIHDFASAADVEEGVTSFLEKRPPEYPLRVPRDFPGHLPAWPGAPSTPRPLA